MRRGLIILISVQCMTRIGWRRVKGGLIEMALLKCERCNDIHENWRRVSGGLRCGKCGWLKSYSGDEELLGDPLSVQKDAMRKLREEGSDLDE